MTPDETSLAQLAIMAQRGDKEAYAALLHECQRWMKSYLGRRIARHDLDDLVQETLFALHQKLATYDSTRAFVPWLAAIARYRWAGHLRQVYRARKHSGGTDVISHNDESAMMARISLNSLFAQLPAPQAQAIELVKIEGLSIAEAACASGQSEALVKINIHRGLKKLSAMIERA
ncbi:DNA-directed RNA polymerase sigma-70 factor [Novosphingobium sediminis]|uniref:DNA-directed RNA polymerase sigma-70 factor n=1 Tax=Novosphingobium sediminis TaxID=707214 RepID=A0A512AN89_9SPHN|nr:sigma-70 family RNA polymerase sigma factor [Novosphingobium sediminis]GEO01183.1 DNA-directed RNA polymerase sigma-70 factor [Novosphingobium sediminis]